jgi:hypothetical protein
MLKTLWAVPVIALVMLVAACDSEDAEEQAQEQSGEQGPLTEDQVTAFIASFPTMRAMGEKYSNELAGMADTSNPNAFGAMMAGIKGSRGYDEYVAAIEKHGFDDMEEWGTVANRVMRAFMAITMEAMRAFMAITMEAHSAQMKADLEQTRKRIEANTSMPAEQKKMMLQQLEASAGMVTGMGVPEADKAIVRRHQAALDRVMK